MYGTFIFKKIELVKLKTSLRQAYEFIKKNNGVFSHFVSYII